MFDKERNVVTALPQRRQVQVDQVDAVEEVFAERVFLDHRPQVCIGGAYNADICSARAAVAQHLVSLVLQHTQQLHLTGQ